MAGVRWFIFASSNPKLACGVVDVRTGANWSGDFVRRVTQSDMHPITPIDLKGAYDFPSSLNSKQGIP